MQDIERELDALFGDVDIPVDATGSLQAIFDAMSDFAPCLLYISDRTGHLLATHPRASPVPDDRIRALAREFAVRLGSRTLATYACESEKALGFALLMPGPVGERLILGGLAEPAARTERRLQAALPLLSCCGVLAAQTIERDQTVCELQVRIRHLQASHDTLEATYSETMAAAIEEHERRMEHKTEFLANMSHEIRTPMTAILGFAENLLGADMSEAENVNAIQTVRRNAQHLLRILNDILDLSKVEAGKLEIERLSSSPFQVLNEAVSVMRIRAEAKGLTLNLEYLGAIPERIHTDPTRLQQILMNLIGNALKFTESGGVRIVTRFVPSESEPAGETTRGPFLQFDVIDTGIGMTPTQVNQVFDPFMQADSSTTRRFGGTGLGLAISRRLAELLGGTIGVESRLGEGSCFRCVIATGPLDGVAMVDDPSKAALIVPEDTPPRTDVGTLDCRILLAEDGQDNQRLISFVLKKAGAEVTVVENGQLAMEAALAASEQGRAFDVILMDMQMPVLDGYSAASLLRRKGYAGPIIALTAHAMASDRRKCLDAGCDDYAVKPIDRKQLFEMINRYTKAEHPTATDA